MKDNVSNKIPELKPFMRLVCRNGTTFIFARQEGGFIGLLQRSWQSWDNNLTCPGAEEYDVVAVYDVPGKVYDYLEVSEKGPLLWKHDSDEQEALKEAVAKARAEHIKTDREADRARLVYLEAIRVAQLRGVDVSAYE